MLKFWFMQWLSLCGLVYGAVLLGAKDPYGALIAIATGSFHVCCLLAMVGWHDRDMREARNKGIITGEEAQKSRAIHRKLAHFEADPVTGKVAFVYGCTRPKCGAAIPPKGTPTMNAQEYYDLLVRTSAGGGFPSVILGPNNTATTCAYRSPQGRKCAVGLLIPDTAYRPEMEGHPADQLADQFGDDWVPEGMSLQQLRSVQDAHDGMVLWSLTPPPWDHIKFVRRLNTLPCFQNVTQTHV